MRCVRCSCRTIVNAGDNSAAQRVQLRVFDVRDPCAVHHVTPPLTKPVAARVIARSYGTAPGLCKDIHLLAFHRSRRMDQVKSRLWFIYRDHTCGASSHDASAESIKSALLCCTGGVLSPSERCLVLPLVRLLRTARCMIVSLILGLP
jgi:hypothetical protein